MKANDFTNVVEELAKFKKLDWTSFREKRIWEIGKKLENRKIDKNQAIVEIAAELKAYNIGRDEIEFLKDRIK